MAVLQDPNIANQIARVEDTDALRVSIVPRGEGYGIAAITGSMAAAIAANALVFAMRLDPAATRPIFIDRIRLQWTTLVAFTTPITAGRRIEIVRGSGNAASGGVATIPANKNSVEAPSEVSLAQGGDSRISTTAALTVTGITLEAPALRVVPLVHLGNAGAYMESIMEFNPSDNAPLVLQPGQLMGIRVGQAMDAAGTWQLGVNVDWTEAPALTA